MTNLTKAQREALEWLRDHEDVSYLVLSKITLDRLVKKGLAEIRPNSHGTIVSVITQAGRDALK